MKAASAAISWCISVSNSRCYHCGDPNPAGAPICHEENGQRFLFCCHGCRSAFLLIRGAGLEQFYQQRQWDEEGLPAGAFDERYSAEYLERHTTAEPDGQRSISIFVEGIRCATCVWLVERMLLKIPGVTQARLNYGTHRARVAFDPERTSAQTIFQTLTRLGYLPRPYEQNHVEEARRREQRSLVIRFVTAAFLSMQLMGYSLALYAGYFQGMSAEARALMQVLSAIVTTPVVFYAGWPFLVGGWNSLRNRSPNMDTLICIGVLAAYFASLHAMVSDGEVYFDTAAMIVTLILAGRLFENMARNRALQGVERLLRVAPATACRLRDGQTETVDTASLAVGDIVLVRPGERFSVDGMVLEGQTEVDESIISGEPLPVLRGAGERVLAGAMNLSASVQVRVTTSAAESFIARIARVVEEAQSRKAPIEQLVNRISRVFVPIVVLVSAGSFTYWSAFPAEHTTPLLAAVAVLIIACPCALGLATPMAVLVGTASAARHGMLFRGGDIVEMTARIDTIAFDKTGTLTEGRPRVIHVEPFPSSTADELLRLAAMAEQGSVHPIARGILEEARRREIPLPSEPHSSTAIAGKGVICPTRHGTIRVGTPTLLDEGGVLVPGSPIAHHEGSTAVHVALEQQYHGVILLEDTPRQDSAATIAHLHTMGIRTALLTGDTRTAGHSLAKGLGIDEVHAEQLPAEKAQWISQRMASGNHVMMVGDGINDAPALSTAHIGCAMAGGTDVALEVSDIVLTRPQPLRIVDALTIARRIRRGIRQNLFWAFIYNVSAIPLAALGFLAPIHAAAAMTISSLCVVGNSLRLRRLS